MKLWFPVTAAVMHRTAKHFYYFYTEVLCFALVVATVSAELRAILINKTCKILQFLCRFVNSAHDGQFFTKFCAWRIAEFWHYYLWPCLDKRQTRCWNDRQEMHKTQTDSLDIFGRNALFCCSTSNTVHGWTSYYYTCGDHVIAVTADFQACIKDGTVSQIVRQRTLAATAALTLA